MEKLLKFLQGKKGVIATMVCIVSTWMYSKQYIDEPTVLMIQSLCAVVTGVASVYTKRIYANLPK